MPPTRRQIRFWLNDDFICLDECGPCETLLDFLRLKRRLTGTKEGCAEGDCGACTILVGRIFRDSLVYESVNACIRFLPSLDGCHIVTIEGLRGEAGGLHPVQQAMIDHHGSQCGFCTPGIVMSLYALWMEVAHPSRAQIETALQGNLCRCTGYAPIIKAAQAINTYGSPARDWLEREHRINEERLTALKDGARVETEQNGAIAFLPANLKDFSIIRSAHPNATIIAGATDVGLWVTKHLTELKTTIYINHLDDLKRIEQDDECLTLGAGVTYSEAQTAMMDAFPHLAGFWSRIGGQQVRNMGTVGGNIANGSPIGDLPPVFIALGAELVLRQGSNQRSIPLENFFLDYGKQDREAGDFIEAIRIPGTGPGQINAAYKISKRRDEDISSVCAAFSLIIEEGLITKARIAFGGMAATPKRALNAETMLEGQPFNKDSLVKASRKLNEDFTPIDDWRASSAYRMRVAKNLFRQIWFDQSTANDGIAAE